jgi:hypothetical protein
MSLSKLKLFLAVTAVLVLIMALALMGVLRLYNSCSFYTIDSLPSPSKGFSLARVEKRCSADIETQPIFFALLSPGAAVRENDIFLTVRAYEARIGEVAVWSPLMVFGKWISENTVRIAAPEGSGLNTSRTEFHGVRIQYAFYPIETSKTNDERLTHIVEKKLAFESKFKTNTGYGTPGAGCELIISGRDGEYADQLYWLLRARIQHAVRWYPAFSSYDFLIVLHNEIEKPGNHATIAKAIGFSPEEGKSTLWAYGLNYPRIDPNWQFGYIPKNPRDLIAMAESVRNGSFVLEVNYWLDDHIVRYSTAGPIDPRQIDEFENCIEENRIFDTPPLSKDR